MKIIAYVLTAFFVLTALPVLAEDLPAVAPVEELTPPALDAPGEPVVQPAAN